MKAGVDALTWTTAEPKPAVVAGPMQDSPDRFVSVMSYPGRPTGNNWQADDRTQIRIRGAPVANAYLDAKKLADRIKGIVAPAGDQLPVIDLAGGRRAPVSVATDLMPLGLDSKGRYEFSINLALTSVRA